MNINVLRSSYGKLWATISTGFFILLMSGCLSSNLIIKTSGTFEGTYVSVEAAYNGPLSFDFTQEDEAIEAQGTITVNKEVIYFEGHGTLSKNPAKLDLDVQGSGFEMHIEGELSGSHLTGTYTFTSTKWGSDSGSVDLDLG